MTDVNFPTVEDEAWALIMAGRNMYTELPDSLRYHDIIEDPKGEVKERVRKWAYRFDNARQERYRVDLLSGEVYVYAYVHIYIYCSLLHSHLH